MRTYKEEDEIGNLKKGDKLVVVTPTKFMSENRELNVGDVVTVKRFRLIMGKWNVILEEKGPNFSYLQNRFKKYEPNHLPKELFEL